MDLTDDVLKVTRAAGFDARLAELLVELCGVDTTPDPDVGRMRDSEARVFDRLERELREVALPGGRPERRKIDPGIAGHPAFSLLHFTKTKDRPDGLRPEAAYAGRCNLVYVVPGASSAPPGSGLALNAHIDVIAPYFPPRVEGDTVYGRGSCDDKGGVVAILAGLRVVSEVLKRANRRLKGNLVCMFVIEEETGGNGSLSLALDRELKRYYDSMLVLECAENKLYPANRGAVWYRTELAMENVSLLEMAAFVVEELENEGRSIKAESRHPLFVARPVQTCHGMIGPWGEHPSRICGRVGFRLDFDRAPSEAVRALIEDCLQAGLANYTGLYGDKTQVMSVESGRPKVERHYDMRIEGTSVLVDVFGCTGHMGSIAENDGAITKMGAMIRSLVYSRARVESLGGTMGVKLQGQAEASRLTLEGGQGFVPTHDIGEVMGRMAEAAARGAAAYLRRMGRGEPGRDGVRTTFEKLHNAAFDGDPHSAAMQRAIEAAKSCGMWWGGPITGWTVSCDARLFATEYPGMSVLTSGPGYIRFAHSDAENVSIKDLRQCVEFLAIYILKQTGTLDGGAHE